MSKARPVHRMSSLSVEFRNSVISGRGVFAKQRFVPGQHVVAYAPKQAKLAASHPEAITAATTKLTLLSEAGAVIVPDTSVPGGWLCNHSCEPNAAIFSGGNGRIECIRPIARGDEVTVFYGWITQNDPGRDPCRCGSQRCRGFINFDLSDSDARGVDVLNGELILRDADLRERLIDYADYLQSIGQEQVRSTIATILAAMRRSLAAKA